MTQEHFDSDTEVLPTQTRHPGEFSRWILPAAGIIALLVSVIFTLSMGINHQVESTKDRAEMHCHLDLMDELHTDLGSHLQGRTTETDWIDDWEMSFAEWQKKIDDCDEISYQH